MIINFVTESEDQTWILRRWCSEWSKHIPDSIITSHKPDQNADVHIYVNYALYKDTDKIDIAYFTHREEENPQRAAFDRIAKECDWCVGQSAYTMSLLPKEKSTMIQPGIGSHLHKEKLKIGISGRPYATGRKRFEWLGDIAKVEGFEIIWTGGEVAYEDMDEFYDYIDIVLVTSDREGGPMCIAEALGMGKQVISTRVGWASQFPTVKLYDTKEELIDILKSYRLPANQWELSAQQFVELSQRFMI